MRPEIIFALASVLLCIPATGSAEQKQLRIRYRLKQTEQHVKPEAGKDEVRVVVRSEADLKSKFPKAYGLAPFKKADFSKHMVVYLQKTYKRPRHYFVDVEDEVKVEKGVFTIKWSLKEIPLGPAPLKERTACVFLIIQKHGGKANSVFKGFEKLK